MVQARLLSRTLNGFEMLSSEHEVGDVFTLDMDSARTVEWHAPVEWLEPAPPAAGTPVVHDKDGGVWVVTKQPNILWVEVVAPVRLLLPLALFDTLAEVARG